jgi:hypothetical protein
VPASGTQVADEWVRVCILVKRVKSCAKAYAHGDAAQATVGTHAEHVHLMFTAQFPLILRLVAIAMTFTTDTAHSDLRVCQ